MRSIAVLSDVHGNMPALEAVLADIHECAPDEVLVGGDLVGRGPEGSKVAKRIRELGWMCVRGNHEDYLLGFRHRRVPEPWLHTEEWAASRWMAAELDDEDVAYLEALPLSVKPRIAKELLLVHGSPRSNDEGLGPWCSESFLEDCIASLDERVLVCAHTHRPLLRRFDSGLIANVGAVGLPFNRDRRAQYAILREDAGEWSVDFRRVDYDLDRTMAIYETSGFLAAGGITARLLAMELEHAAPFLVPFMKWAEAKGRPARISEIDSFLDFYDIDELPQQFFTRLASDPGRP